MTEIGLDVIGDVHGSLAPLRGLLGDLGYAPDGGYSHPERRTLVFLGDLIDHGPRSLESATFVMDLCAGRRAHCLMGNHEYNLLTPPVPKPAADLWSWARSHVALASPFRDGKLIPGLPAWGVDGSHETCHEVLIKGFEHRPPRPIVDPEGVERRLARARWCSGESPEVATDIPVVFGHYWNLPPDAADATAPPHVNGSAEDRRWVEERSARVPETGRRLLSPERRHICVDYNGLLKASGRGCIGAYRWPAHEVVWRAEP